MTCPPPKKAKWGKIMLRKEVYKRMARELSVQFLFQHEFAPTEAPPAKLEAETKAEAQAQAQVEAQEAPLPPPRSNDEAFNVARWLVRGVLRHQEGIDALIAQHSVRWPLQRMALVDRNALRVAVFEMKFAATPPKVALDEALEVVRKYSDTQSVAFVNGVLDSVMQKLQPSTL